MLPMSRLLPFLGAVFFFTDFASAQSAHTLRCCRKLGVSSACADALCDAASPPSDLDIYTVFSKKGSNCAVFLDEISECLNQGRDNSACCEREAADSDRDACLGLCASRSVLSAPWNSVQSCLAINKDSMYECISKGYRNSPTPPENFRVEDKSPTTATLKWDLPLVHASLVQFYKIYVAEQSLEEKGTETVWETTDLELYLPSLREDRVYTARIVAVRNSSHKSLAAPILHFSTSELATNLQAYRSLVPTAVDAKTSTLVCRLRYIAEGPKEMTWERANKGGRTWRPVVESTRHHINDYISDEGSHGIFRVSSLEITNIDVSDLGEYRCRYLGESGVIRFLAVTKPAPNFESPPESALDCCQRHGVREGCESACRRGLLEKTRSIRPGVFLPHYKCIDEFSSLLKCSLGGMSHGGCCLRKKVPFHCLGLCDSRQEVPNLLATDCISHLDSIYSCQLEEMDAKPAVVTGVEVVGDTTEAQVKWDKSERAMVYHVYSEKQDKDEWTVEVTEKTSTTVRNADTIVIVAANNRGLSPGNARTEFIKGEWQRIEM